MTDMVDVLIVGGGPVGACLASLLARAGFSRVMVLEPKRPSMPSPQGRFDLRVVACSRASERILIAAGAWEGIVRHRISPYERMRVWHESVAPTDSAALVFDAAEVGEPNLGHIIENSLMQAALLEGAEQAGAQIAPAELRSLRVTDDCVHVETSNGSFAARLVVGADGANSAVRREVGLAAEAGDYGQTAIVAVVATGRPHENTAWQRFMRDGTLAFLPLADGTSSIVWSADDARATPLLAASGREFAARAGSRLGSRAGRDSPLERASVLSPSQAGSAAIRRASLRIDRRCSACRASTRRPGREPWTARCRSARRINHCRAHRARRSGCIARPQAL